ncbi:sugar phosphate isomerase/epimerase family protein [Streptomyces shenzhenensis]|uniref:sugar phosphate isomerase/epimerase family protein n=1 Tax=Streptomyces shenzhenensis TaxID=943815 RepID=UPI0033F46116
MTFRLAAQDGTLPGACFQHRFEAAQRYGFDGIEIAVPVTGDNEDRLARIESAVQRGVQISSAVVASGPFIGELEPADRRRAVRQLSLLIDQLGSVGVPALVMPHSFGIASRHLPTSGPLPPAEEARLRAAETLGVLSERAAAAGVLVCLEPLNRYEDYAVNTLSEAATVVEAAASPALAVVADTFHMSIEERDISRSLRSAARFLSHIQLGDSDRLEPGHGHFDWPVFLSTLAELGYDGWLAMECGLSGPPEHVLPHVSRLLRNGARRAEP